MGTTLDKYAMPVPTHSEQLTISRRKRVIDGAREGAFVHSRRAFEPKHFILECRRGPAGWNRCTTKPTLSICHNS